MRRADLMTAAEVADAIGWTPEAVLDDVDQLRPAVFMQSPRQTLGLDPVELHRSALPLPVAFNARSGELLWRREDIGAYLATQAVLRAQSGDALDEMVSEALRRDVLRASFPRVIPRPARPAS